MHFFRSETNQIAIGKNYNFYEIHVSRIKEAEVRDIFSTRCDSDKIPSSYVLKCISDLSTSKIIPRLRKYYQKSTKIGVKGIKLLDDNFSWQRTRPDLNITIYDDSKLVRYHIRTLIACALWLLIISKVTRVSFKPLISMSIWDQICCIEVYHVYGGITLKEMHT